MCSKCKIHTGSQRCEQKQAVQNISVINFILTKKKKNKGKKEKIVVMIAQHGELLNATELYT